MERADYPTALGNNIYQHYDTVTLNNRIAGELDAVKQHTSNEVAFIRDMVARDRTATIELQKTVIHLTAMVDVLFRALAEKGAIDMNKAKEWMADEMRRLNPPPEEAPVVAVDGYRGR